MTDTSPLLTPSQRELLDDLATDPDTDADRRELSRLRSRVRSVIIDFRFLLAALTAEERTKLFEDLGKYQEWQERKWDKPAVEVGPEGAVDEPGEGEEGPLSGGTRHSSDIPDAVETEGEKLHNGIVAALGFLYAGVDDTPTFEAMLEDAVRQSRLADGKVAVDVDATVDMEREEQHSALVEKLQAREIDESELASLWFSDPVAVIRSELDGDSPEGGPGREPGDGREEHGEPPDREE